MKIKKTFLKELNKCYSLAKINIADKKYVVCAAEKTDPCYMFDYNGNYIETLWDGPGGVMSMEQYEGEYPTLIATYQFYSPNDSKNAKIVYYQKINNEWKMEVLVDLPFVHRFGVISRNKVNYLVACTLKSDHQYKDDFTTPGKVYVGKLENDLTSYNENHQLKMEPILDGVFHNHGFFKTTESNYEICLVGSDQGVHKITPPEKENEKWKIEHLIEHATSDMLFVDFDNDGQQELLTLAPFHGNELLIYKLKNGKYENVYTHPEKLDFLHAITTMTLNGKQVAIIGNRGGEKQLLCISYDKQYKVDVIDQGAGPANCLCFDENKLIAANRETNEIAMYEFIKD